MHLKFASAFLLMSLSICVACTSSNDNISDDESQGGDTQQASGGSGGKGGAVGGGKGGAGGAKSTGGQSGSGGSGGLPFAEVKGGSGGATLDAGIVGLPDAPVVDNHGDDATWNFESSSQGWVEVKSGGTVATSTVQQFRGRSSLAFAIDVTAAELNASRSVDAGADAGGATVPERMLALLGTHSKLARDPVTGEWRPLWSGKSIKLRVYATAGLNADFFTLFTYGAPGGWKDSGATVIVTDKWMELTMVAPNIGLTDAFAFSAVGLYISGWKEPWKGTIYIDSVEAN